MEFGGKSFYISKTHNYHNVLAYNVLKNLKTTLGVFERLLLLGAG